MAQLDEVGALCDYQRARVAYGLALGGTRPEPEER
jgi:hypothetical protein